MIYDTAIIGGGPAGITAAIYISRKGLKTLLLTKNFSAGQTAKASQIDNWPGEFRIAGVVLMDKLKDNLKNFSIEIVDGVRIVGIGTGSDPASLFEVKGDNDKKYLARTIIIASGAKPRLLGIPGEKELTGRGVGYCSICDAPFFKDKQVAIVGGGNSGMLAVLDLAKYAKKIYLFEAEKKLLADSILVEQAKATNKLEIFFEARIKEILGKDKVEAIIFEKQGKVFQQPMSGVFVEIGFAPASDFVKEFVELNEKGEIKVDSLTLSASQEAVFACGDVCSASIYKQLIIAAGQGAVAALSAHKYLDLERAKN